MVAIRSKPMPRRTFLRSGAVGTGIVIGLPVLDAMMNSSGTALAAAPLPARFISWFFGSGFDPDLIESRATTGSPIVATDPLNPHLAHFAGLEGYVSVCSGIQNRSNASVDPHHNGKDGNFSGYRPIPGPNALQSDWGGPTIDQEIARLIDTSGFGAPIPSIQIGISKIRASDDDTGTSAQFLSMSDG
jgi:hypothetical protein